MYEREGKSADSLTALLNKVKINDTNPLNQVPEYQLEV